MATKAEKEAKLAAEKAEIVATLTAAGIAFDENLSVKELKALIPKSDKNSATVVWPGGVRVYSKDVHGEDYEDLAEEFATKKGGTVQ